MESASPERVPLDLSPRSPGADSRGPTERWEQRRGFFFWALIAVLNPPVALAALWIGIRHPHTRGAAKRGPDEFGSVC